MAKDNIDPLTVEEICEEKFDRFTVVVHSALRQDLVHRLEHKVLVHDLLRHPIIKFIEADCMCESVQEDFVGDRCVQLYIILVLHFVVFADRKLV